MSDELFSRDEILGGGLGRTRRARALLYLIEQEASRAADLARYSVAFASPEALALADVIVTADPEVMKGALPGEADDAFIASFRNARRDTHDATVRDLERGADSWKVLLPDDLALRVAVFQQLSDQHQLERSNSRKICAAFGIDEPAFAAAFEKAAGKPVTDAFVPDTGLGAKVRKLFGRG